MAKPEDDQGKGQQYVVKADFTDDKGRKWSAGTAFTGDEAAVRKALAAGQIASKPKGGEAETAESE